MADESMIFLTHSNTHREQFGQADGFKYRNPTFTVLYSLAEGCPVTKLKSTILITR